MTVVVTKAVYSTSTDGRNIKVENETFIALYFLNCPLG